MIVIEKSQGWHFTRIDAFWNKIAFKKKVFHIKEDEKKFIEILAGFVGTGVNVDDCTVVIASSLHLELLQQALEEHGLHTDKLIEDQRYLPLNAEKIMSKFMIDGLPDEQLFFQCISDIFSLPKCKNRSIRAYREMSSILLQQGNTLASIQLENLWTKYREKEDISLFCSYPKLLSDTCLQLRQIGVYNCKIVSSTHSVADVFYRDCIGN